MVREELDQESEVTLAAETMNHCLAPPLLISTWNALMDFEFLFCELLMMVDD
jgi:hypothetical protein